MSGHSKWSTIKRKKEQKDAARGKIFTRVIKEITIAARQGGGSVNVNPRLRTAILAAKTENVPQANIDRAIARGTGELDGDHYEELVYEGYGPAGVALLVEAVTDNKNRTTSEMRHAFTKNGGNMGEAGCVAWMFDQKGTIVVDKNGVDADEVMMIALDAGAEDILDEGDTLAVFTAVSDYESVRAQFEENGFAPLRAEIGRIPQSTVAVAGKDAEQLLRLMEVLEDHDDVQHVYANFDVDDGMLEKMNG